MWAARPVSSTDGHWVHPQGLAPVCPPSSLQLGWGLGEDLEEAGARPLGACSGWGKPGAAVGTGSVQGLGWGRVGLRCPVGTSASHRGGLGVGWDRALPGPS